MSYSFLSSSDIDVPLERGKVGVLLLSLHHSASSLFSFTLYPKKGTEHHFLEVYFTLLSNVSFYPLTHYHLHSETTCMTLARSLIVILLLISYNRFQKLGILIIHNVAIASLSSCDLFPAPNLSSTSRTNSPMLSFSASPLRPSRKPFSSRIASLSPFFAVHFGLSSPPPHPPLPPRPRPRPLPLPPLQCPLSPPRPRVLVTGGSSGSSVAAYIRCNVGNSVGCDLRSS